MTGSRRATNVGIVLRMTPDVRDEMFAHALTAVPLEACGMFSSAAGETLVDYFHPMHNARESATVFALDGQEMLDLERGLDETDRNLVGVMHSHTMTTAYPSLTDVRDSASFDPRGHLKHVIVSLRDAEPVLRCFTIIADEITELPVLVTDGDDDTQDQGGAVAAVMSLRRPEWGRPRV